MSDIDRDLSERLTSVPAEPRSEWVAELRADLSAGFDTGDLPQRIVFGQSRRPRWRLEVGVALAVVAALVALIVVVARGSEESPDSPADTSAPTASVATTGAVVTTTPVAPTDTTPQAGTSAPTVATSSSVAGIPPAPCPVEQAEQPAYAAAYASSLVRGDTLWRILPEARCLSSQGSVDGLMIEERDLVTGALRTSRSVPSADIAAATGTPWTLRLAMYPARIVDFAGVRGRSVVLHLAADVVEIDVDAGTISATTLDDPARVVTVVGDALIAVNRASVQLLDVAADTAVTSTQPGLDVANPQPGPDALYVCSSDYSQIFRVDASGAIQRLEQFTGLVQMCALTPVEGGLWAIVLPAGTEPSMAGTPEVSGTAVLARLDPIDGHTLAVAPAADAPAGNFIAFAAPDGFLALLGDWVPGTTLLFTRVLEHWWWIDNEGTRTVLTPPDGVTVIGVGEGRIIGYDQDYRVVSYAVADLMPSG